MLRHLSECVEWRIKIHANGSKQTGYLFNPLVFPQIPTYTSLHLYTSRHFARLLASSNTMGILDNLPAKVLAADKLPTWFPVHHFNEPSYNYTTGVALVDWRQPSLWIALGMILFNPVYWNLVARNGASVWFPAVSQSRRRGWIGSIPGWLQLHDSHEPSPEPTLTGQNTRTAPSRICSARR